MLWPGGSEANWRLFRRITTGPYGMFTRGGSTLAFSLKAFSEGEVGGRSTEPLVYSERIREEDAVFMSNVSRPLEMTFDQFTVPEGEEARAIFRARLAEEEGLQSYRLYVGTEESIYVGRPSVQDRAVTLRPVTTSFGVGTNGQGRPALAFVPGGAILKATNGQLYALSGRKTERLFADEQVPFGPVTDIAYDRQEEDLLIATPQGLWAFDRERGGLMAQVDMDAESLVWDEDRGHVIAYAGGQWQVIHWNGWPVDSIDAGADEVALTDDYTSDFNAGDRVEVPPLGDYQVSSVSLSGGHTVLALDGDLPDGAPTHVRKYRRGTVVTQPLTHGGRELSMGEVAVDYDRLDYDVSDGTTYATLTQTRRHSEDEVSTTLPRGYGVHPGLRGEGLQLEVDDFTELTEVRVENIEPAN